MCMFLYLFTWEEASYCITMYNSLGFGFSGFENVADVAKALV